MAELAGSAGTVHVACCFDRQMELPFLVLASSLKRHLKGDRKVILHAFHSDSTTWLIFSGSTPQRLSFDCGKSRIGSTA
jgi:hypothetical protein